LKGVQDLSTKLGLEFGLSAAEKEKEQLLVAESRKEIEQQKKNAELQKAAMDSQQLQTNVKQEKNLLQEQNERQYREWKSRVDLESKLREQQISTELQAGFEDRANRLRAELATSQQQTMQMMMQMRKDANESEAKLAQLLMEQSRTPPATQPEAARKQPGLLTSLLTPVTGLVDGLLAPVTGGILGGKLL